ncbi:MAG: phosphoribosylformylglycinamidine synthase subunit PurS [Thermodesulfobacteriota bacterium]|nr:phosphoribosylformylglycinamidine synthase subunit PurS [Thermodesulfobacteriota bacterium]
MLAKIYVTLKNGVLDPQGKAVQHSLESLGYREVKDVRLGKYMEVQIDSMNRDEAQARVSEMCEKLLSNPVIEDYRFEIYAE